MGFEGYIDKTALSESIIHERSSDIHDQKQTEGYEQRTDDQKVSEVFGLRNSFDDIAVGMDDKDNMTIAVTSQKEPFSPTLNSDRKRLKGKRRRTLYEHFGEFYTNPSSPGSSAYAYKARKALSENRILSEFRRTSERRLTEEQKQMAPFLTLERDRLALNKMKGRQDSSPERERTKGRLEESVLRKTEMENRFLRKLRLARKQSAAKKGGEEKAASLIYQEERESEDEGEEDKNDNNKE